MLKDRVAEARAAAKFSQVMRRDAQGRPAVISVPGHNGKRYTVIIRRQKGKMSTECLVGNIISSQDHCPGSLKTICYHQLAAVITAAAESKLEVYFFETYKEAKNFSNLGGVVNSLTGFTSSKVIWMVIK